MNGVIKDAPTVVGAGDTEDLADERTLAEQGASAEGTPFLGIDTDPFSTAEHEDDQVVGGDPLTFHQDFTQYLLSSAAIVGPTLSFTNATLTNHFNSDGTLVPCPHNLLENANWSARTADIPSGWAATVTTGEISWQDHADGYSIAMITVDAAERYSWENNVAVSQNHQYTFGFYFHSGNLTGGQSGIVLCQGTSGTDASITQPEIDALGGAAGWYAVTFEMGADTTVNIVLGSISAGISDTSSLVISRPFVIDGNITGAALDTPVYFGANESDLPTRAWIGTDDGDEPLYAARLASHVYNGSSWVNKGVRTEEARTNLCLQSEDFSTTWTNSNSTDTADQIAAPDGNTTADLITATGGSPLAHRIGQQITVASGTTVAVSMFVKAGAGDFFSLLWGSGSTSENFISVVFDVSSGSTETSATETDVGTTSGTIVATYQEDIGNDWFRCTVVGSVAATNPFYFPGIAEAATGNTFNTFGEVTFLQAGETLYFWGAQAEAGAFPTSYIATTTASVTRNADRPNTTDVSWLDSSIGTTVAQIYIPIDTNERSACWNWYDSASPSNRRYYLWFPDVSGNIAANYLTNLGGNDGTVEISDSGKYGTDVKVAVSYETDHLKCAVDGTLGTEDTTVDCEITIDTAYFGELGYVGNFQINGFINFIKYYNVAHDDSTLQSETS